MKKETLSYFSSTKVVVKNLIMTLVIASMTGGVFDADAAENKTKSEVKVVEETKPIHKITHEKVNREEKLQNFFKKYNSPLVENADTFIEVADKYDMDYRLLPAISCLESSCGKKLIPQSYNPFGWGVYGGNYIAFADYDEAIEEVGLGLHKGYIQKGATTVEQIAPIYNPPNPVKWGSSIRFFMNQIDNS